MYRLILLLDGGNGLLAMLRTNVRPLLISIVRPLAALGITPNQVTLASIPLGMLAAWFFMTHEYVLGLFVLALSVVADALDGALASLQNASTPQGNYLDAVTDRITESFFLLGFVIDFPVPALLALAGSNLVSYAKARAGLVMIADNRDWPGIGERSERLIVLVAGVALAVVLPDIFGYPTMALALWLIVVLTWIGGLHRLNTGMKRIQHAAQNDSLLPYLKPSVTDSLSNRLKTKKGDL